MRSLKDKTDTIGRIYFLLFLSILFFFYSFIFFYFLQRYKQIKKLNIYVYLWSARNICVNGTKGLRYYFRNVILKFSYYYFSFVFLVQTTFRPWFGHYFFLLLFIHPWLRNIITANINISKFFLSDEYDHDKSKKKRKEFIFLSLPTFSIRCFLLIFHSPLYNVEGSTVSFERNSYFHTPYLFIFFSFFI